MEILVRSQVLPSSGTTVQSKSAAVDEELPVIVLPSWQLKPPSVGILKVQVQAARLGARPENSWTATAPNPAASAFEIMAMSGLVWGYRDIYTCIYIYTHTHKHTCVNIYIYIGGYADRRLPLKWKSGYQFGDPNTTDYNMLAYLQGSLIYHSAVEVSGL